MKLYTPFFLPLRRYEPPVKKFSCTFIPSVCRCRVSFVNKVKSSRMKAQLSQLFFYAGSFHDKSLVCLAPAGCLYTFCLQRDLPWTRKFNVACTQTRLTQAASNTPWCISLKVITVDPYDSLLSSSNVYVVSSCGNFEMDRNLILRETESYLRIL